MDLDFKTPLFVKHVELNFKNINKDSCLYNNEFFVNLSDLK